MAIESKLVPGSVQLDLVRDTTRAPASYDETRAQALALATPGSKAEKFLRHAAAALGPVGQPLELRALPIEVYQAVLEARGQTMKAFFESWAVSIAENAQRDRAASRKAELNKAEIARLALANEHFVPALKALTGLGHQGRELAKAFAAAARAD